MAELKTAFWKKAAERLPENYRARYISYLKRAENFDLALDAIEGAVARIRNAFHSPKHA